MSTPSERNGCLNGLYLGLAALGLWLGWKVTVAIFGFFSELALGLFSQLDASYGQLGGAAGYALLGLGLGAAAGAIAAQRRFQLDRRILVGAIVGAVALTGLAFLGNSDPATTQDEPMDYDLDSVTIPPTPAREPNPQVDAYPVSRPDTTSEPAEGWLRIVASDTPLWVSWVDSVAAPQAYLQQEDSVQLLRRARSWALVRHPAAISLPGTIGWTRLADLGPLPEPAATPEPITQALTKKPAMPLVITAIADSAAATRPDFPVGHHAYTGQIGERSTTYSLDWQPSGVLSGSFYYDQQPGNIYRLTGAFEASGELTLLVFKQGQQAAKCVLQPQGSGYAGTLLSPDGQQFAMSLE